MKLIIGLGNPGLCYKHTKHNAGFWVVEKVARELGRTLNKCKFNSRWTQDYYKGQKLILVKPLTFMNLSGKTVRNFVEYFKIRTKDILVIFDDISLELGTIRVRPSGGAGGHNGLLSVIDSLGTKDFPRLRFGIRTANVSKSLSNYVLTRFKKDEDMLLAQKAVEIAKGAVFCWVNRGVNFCMNKYNAKRREFSDDE